MKQLWLLLAFVLVMMLIGYGWQGEVVTAGPVDAEATATSTSFGSSRP
jgi:hypothetical protein